MSLFFSQWKPFIRCCSKIEYVSLDDNDVNILKVLQWNGRLSFRQVSEKVKVSVPTVSNKVGNLERLGVIRGYHAELDPERMGQTSALVTIKAKPADLSLIAERFKSDDQVRQLYHMSSGKLILVCTFMGSHLINDFVMRLASVPEIQEYDIANVISVSKELDRAVVAPGLSIIVSCSQCGKEIRSDPLRVKVNGITAYLCCPQCLSTFRSINGDNAK
jgi:DNA-binding Lrp family transcriptional regulator